MSKKDLYFGKRQIKDLYYGKKPVMSLYYGKKLVWERGADFNQSKITIRTNSSQIGDQVFILDNEGMLLYKNFLRENYWIKNLYGTSDLIQYSNTYVDFDSEDNVRFNYGNFNYNSYRIQSSILKNRKFYLSFKPAYLGARIISVFIGSDVSSSSRVEKKFYCQIGEIEEESLIEGEYIIEEEIPIFVPTTNLQTSTLGFCLMDNQYGSFGQDTDIIVKTSIPSVWEGVVEGNTMKNIYNGLFSGAIGFKTIELPSSIDSIDSNAFSDCLGLEKIKINKEPNSIPGYETKWGAPENTQIEWSN